MSESRERYSEVFRFLTDQAREEREAHLSGIEFNDIADQVHLLGEAKLQALMDADITQISAQEIISVKTHEPVRHIRLSDLTVTEIASTEFIPSGDIESLRLTQDGAFAAKQKNSDEIIVGDLRRRADRKKFILGEPTSYGFLADGRLVHLDEAGVVNMDGEPIGLNPIRPRRFRKDIIMPICRIEISGTLVLLQELELNEGHARDMSEHTYWIGAPPSDYYTNWYYLHHRVVEVCPEAMKNVFSATIGLRQEELTGPLYGRKTLKTDLHYGGFISFIEQHNFTMADAFYGLPLYDKVHFFAHGKKLGNCRVDSSLLGSRALAVSNDGKIGFVGKSDGTIEVIDLGARPDAGSLQAQFEQTAWIEREQTRNPGLAKSRSRTVAHFSSELKGDPYPHRRAPKSVTFWKAHNEPITKLYCTDSEVCSVDSMGEIKRWQLVPAKAA